MVHSVDVVPERSRTAGDAAVDGLSAGDAAVDGLSAGAGGGIAMAGVLVVSGLLAGAGPTSVLARFDPANAASPLTGALIHLAVSAVYGLLFGVSFRLVGRGRLAGRMAGALIGVAFGLLLFLVAQGLLATPAGAALREIPVLHLAAAHLAYGAVTGWLVGRS